jgi:glycosyltransferase involved in cell wall biosynthesis
MRFHLVGLPHSQVTTEFSACPYTDKLRKFCLMMAARGHEVFLYAGDHVEAPVAEVITCFSEADRADFVGDRHYTATVWSSRNEGWKRLNANAIREIGRRLQPDDFILLSGGVPHRPVADAFPDAISVEYGIGYNRTFAKYRVFESYAWMHMVYGSQSNGDPFSVGGHWFDAVIPSPVDTDQFPVRTDGEGYYLFIGRLVTRKGYEIAIDVCRELGVNLIMAGQGEAPQGVRHVGIVGPKVRAHLMSGATAVFVPTLYVEPFGNVHVEAMACGTPVITTDWGVFTETVEQGVNGFRCRTFAEFVDAARLAPSLDRPAIRQRAIARFSLEAVSGLYEDYFNRLALLRSDGWATRHEGAGSAGAPRVSN